MKKLYLEKICDKICENNMHNYNTSSIRNKEFDTMKLIIGKYDNTKSKPIKRKREQEGGITEERKRTACYNIGRESLCNRKTGRRSPERKRVRRKLQWGERKGCGFQ